MSRVGISFALAGFLLLPIPSSMAQTLHWYVVAASYPSTRGGEAAARRDAASVMLECGVGLELADVMFSQHFTVGRISSTKAPSG